MPEGPGGKRDRRANRLKGTRRERDHQTLDVAGQALLEPPGNRLDVPVVQVGLPRRYRLKRAVDEGRQIGAKAQVKKPSFESAQDSPLLLSRSSRVLVVVLAFRSRRSSRTASASCSSALRG